MTDTRFVCSACGRVFSDHRAVVDPDDAEEILACPNCGSTRFEPYEFDPDGPAQDPVEGPEDEGSEA